MEDAVNRFSRACVVGTEKEALDIWRESILPLLTNDVLCVASADYAVNAEKAWWFFCKKFNRLQDGEDAMQRLMLSHHVPWKQMQSLLEAARAYTIQLRPLRTVTLPSFCGKGFRASSPSIVPNPDDPSGFLVNIRHVNYYYEENSHNSYPLLDDYLAQTPDPREHVVKTQNVLAVCDANMRVLQSFPLEDETSVLKWPSPVRGMEDLRLVSLPNGKLVAVGISRETRATTMPQPVLMTVDWPKKRCTGGIVLQAHVPEADVLPQKNWLPFWDTESQRLLAFFSMGPRAIVYAIEASSGQCSPVSQWTTGAAQTAVSGGAPPVPWENGMFLSVVHTSYHPPNKRRQYFHRFVLHAKAPSYQPLAVSQLWNFSGVAYDTEFVLSCAKASPVSYWIGYSQNDNACHLAEVSIETIKDLTWYKISAPVS
jgi:hypothetical protein